MSNYSFSNIFTLDIDIPGLPDFTDEESYKYLDEYPYANLNQLLTENIQGTPEQMISEISEILKDHPEENDLAKFLNQIGVTLDYKSKYWGSFKSAKEFLQYMKGFFEEL